MTAPHDFPFLLRAWFVLFGSVFFATTWLGKGEWHSPSHAKSNSPLAGTIIGNGDRPGLHPSRTVWSRFKVNARPTSSLTLSTLNPHNDGL